MPLLLRCPTARVRSLARVLLCAAIAGPAAARDWGEPLFAWTDDQGVVRYTTHPDTVPAGDRDTLREVRQAALLPDAGSPSYDTDPTASRAGAGGAGNGSAAYGAAGEGPGGATAETAPEREGSEPQASRVTATTHATPQLALSSLDREIAALQARIAHDEELLKTLISDPEAAPEISGSADLAAIAERLPEQQAALRELLAERERVQNGS